MRRFTFALLLAGVSLHPLGAQQVPGRELLEFPIAFGAEAPALADELGGGLRNPATIRLAPSVRRQLAIAALSTPRVQGVDGQYLALSLRIARGLVGGFSIARAQVSDLVRADADPNSSVPEETEEIPYRTTILSAGVARERGWLTLGAAARYRRGVADADRSGAFSLDVGARVDRPRGIPLRAGIATFLLSRGGHERSTISAAIEAPVMYDSTYEAGAGYSFARTEGYGHERYGYLRGRWRAFDLRGGLAENVGVGGETMRRLRLGLGVVYARYTIGLSREETGAGIGASYQFTFTSVFK
jgi:hypothetical protein